MDCCSRSCFECNKNICKLCSLTQHEETNYYQRCGHLKGEQLLLSTDKGGVIQFNLLTSEYNQHDINKNRNPIDYIFVRNKKIFTVCYNEKRVETWDESLSERIENKELNVLKLNQVLPLPNDLIAFAAGMEYGVYNFKTNKIYNSVKSLITTDYINVCKGPTNESLFFRAVNGEVFLYNFTNDEDIDSFHIKFNFGMNSLLKTFDNKLVTIMNKDIYVMDIQGEKENIYINSMAKNGLLNELLDKRIIYTSKESLNLLDRRTGNKDVLKIEGIPFDLVQFNENDLTVSTNNWISRWDLRKLGLPYFRKNFDDNIVKICNAFSKELDFSS